MKALLLTLLISLVGCASKPPLWYDTYGILHNENPSNLAIQSVKLVEGYDYIPNGCIRLRNIYFSGTSYLTWDIKREAAKMNATHANKVYVNGLQDTMAVAYDCSQAHKYDTIRKMQRLILRNKLISEKEKRVYEKGHSNYRKVAEEDKIPTLEY